MENALPIAISGIAIFAASTLHSIWKNDRKRSRKLLFASITLALIAVAQALVLIFGIEWSP